MASGAIQGLHKDQPYQDGHEADEEGDEEDADAVEMHCAANGAARALGLAGGLGHLRVHQETPVGHREQPELLPTPSSPGAVPEEGRKLTHVSG